MRIQFDYKNPSSETVSEVLKLFKKLFTEEMFDDLEIGKINVYVDLKNKKTGDSIVVTDLETDKEMKWLVKHQKMKKTKKILIASSTEKCEEEFFVYKG